MIYKVRIFDNVNIWESELEVFENVKLILIVKLNDFKIKVSFIISGNQEKEKKRFYIKDCMQVLI